MKPFKKFNTPENKQVSQLQSNVEEVFLSLYPNDLLAGYIPKETTGALKVFTIKTTDTEVNHGLGRTYKGYIIIDRDANSIVYTSRTINNNKNKVIILKASVQVNVSIFFF